MSSVVDDYKELFNELYDAGITHLSRAEVIELLKIDAICGLSRAIRNCFESNNRLPSIPEAIVMAGTDISKSLSSIEISCD